MEPELVERPFRFYIKRNKKLFAIGLVCLLFTNILDALPPLLIGKVLDQITQDSGMETISHTILLLLGTVVSLAFFRYLWRIFWGRFHHSVAEDLKNRLFDKLTLLTPSFYHKHSVGELMSLMTADVNTFRMSIGPGILILVDAIFILFIVPPLMLSLSVSWTLKTLILMPLIPFIIARIMKLIHSRYRDQRDKFAEMTGSAQEIVSGIRVIKSYNQEQNQTRLFNLFNRKYEIAANQVAKVDSFFSPVLELGVTAGSVILLIVGAPDVMAGNISIGEFFAFYQYIQRMIWPMTALGMGLTMIQRGNASFHRISELLKAPLDVVDSGEHQVNEFHSLEVKDLSFTYPNENKPCLQNISFSLKSGETLGVVGATGSGKSTLIDLLCRQYPLQKGEIQFNGQPLESISLTSLRKTVSVVPQDPFLFGGKVAENIALGRDRWDMSDVKHVAELVNIEKEIENLPAAYDTYLGEKGINLSGGQKQRLTIARALIRQSPFVILDDSLSAVDASTEASILKSLQGGIKKTASEESPIHKTTAIIISHRLASLKWADKIMVLNKGQVEAIGSHEELLSQSPTYKHLHKIQSGEVGA